MDHGYPKFENRDGNNIFTLRVPRFSSSAAYNPIIIVVGYEPYQTQSDGDSHVLRVSVLAVCAALLSSVTFTY